MPKHFAKIFEVEGQQILYRIDLNDDYEEVINASIYGEFLCSTNMGPFEEKTASEVLDSVTQKHANNYYKSYKALIQKN